MYQTKAAINPFVLVGTLLILGSMAVIYFVTQGNLGNFDLRSRASEEKKVCMNTKWHNATQCPVCGSIKKEDACDEDFFNGKPCCRWGKQGEENNWNGTPRPTWNGTPIPTADGTPIPTKTPKPTRAATPTRKPTPTSNATEYGICSNVYTSTTCGSNNCCSTTCDTYSSTYYSDGSHKTAGNKATCIENATCCKWTPR